MSVALPALPFIVAPQAEGFGWTARGSLGHGQRVTGEGETPGAAENEVRRLARIFQEARPLEFRLEPPPAGASATIERLGRRLAQPHRLRSFALGMHCTVVLLVHLCIWIDARTGLLPLVLVPFYFPVYALVFLLGHSSPSLAELGLLLTFGTAWVLLLASVADRRRLRRLSHRYCGLVRAATGHAPVPT